MTNFERIKEKILNINIDEFIEYCGGDTCDNILCREVSGNYVLCRGSGRSLNCGTCIKEFLEAEIEQEVRP